MLWCIKKKWALLLLVLLNLVCVPGIANTNTLIQQQITHAHQLQKTKQNDMAVIKQWSRDTMERYASTVQPMIRSRSAPPTSALPTTPQAMVFVSLGLPKTVLLQTLEEAHAFHIPVVIRGLVDHSFRKTMTVLFNVVKNNRPKKIDGVLIDPMWFQQFHITSVPAVVVSQRSRACAPQRTCSQTVFDVVRGNISVQRALEIIAQNGTAAPEVARSLLRKYGHA